MSTGFLFQRIQVDRINLFNISSVAIACVKDSMTRAPECDPWNPQLCLIAGNNRLRILHCFASDSWANFVGDRWRGSFRPKHCHVWSLRHDGSTRSWCQKPCFGVKTVHIVFKNLQCGQSQKDFKGCGVIRRLRFAGLDAL